MRHAFGLATTQKLLFGGHISSSKFLFGVKVDFFPSRHRKTHRIGDDASIELTSKKQNICGFSETSKIKRSLNNCCSLESVMTKVKRMTYIFPSAVAGTASVLWVSLIKIVEGLLDSFGRIFRGNDFYPKACEKRKAEPAVAAVVMDVDWPSHRVTETTKGLFDSPRNYRLLLFPPLFHRFLFCRPTNRTRLDLSSCSLLFIQSHEKVEQLCTKILSFL